jgi:hypothetical protein
MRTLAPWHPCRTDIPVTTARAKPTQKLRVSDHWYSMARLSFEKYLRQISSLFKDLGAAFLLLCCLRKARFLETSRKAFRRIVAGIARVDETD